MAGTGLELLFPAWGIPTDALAAQMIAAGLKAKITCVNPSKLPRSFAGAEFDQRFLDSLPAGVDPCGENGEFHSFVYEAPVFTNPLRVRDGEVVERDGFVFADVMPA
jgi:diphthamide synthase (EF-2-diphthine--ammonia ligase)